MTHRILMTDRIHTIVVKILGQFAHFYSALNCHPPPLKQCWLSEEVTEKFHVNNKVKYLIDEITLFQGGRGACKIQG